MRRVRALVVTNMYPTAERPALGSFVRDQVEALRRRDDVEVELFAFPPGRATRRAARELRRRFRGTRFDVVHAHFGLTAWPAVLARLGPVLVTLHGNDLFHPRSKLHHPRGLPFVDAARRGEPRVQRQRPRRRADRRVAVLPVGIDMDALPPDPARGGARAPRPRPRRAATCSSRTTRPAAEGFDRAQEAAGDARC